MKNSFIKILYFLLILIVFTSRYVHSMNSSSGNSLSDTIDSYFKEKGLNDGQVRIVNPLHALKSFWYGDLHDLISEYVMCKKCYDDSIQSNSTLLSKVSEAAVKSAFKDIEKAVKAGVSVLYESEYPVDSKFVKISAIALAKKEGLPEIVELMQKYARIGKKNF